MSQETFNYFFDIALFGFFLQYFFDYFQPNISYHLYIRPESAAPLKNIVLHWYVQEYMMYNKVISVFNVHLVSTLPENYIQIYTGNAINAENFGNLCMDSGLTIEIIDYKSTWFREIIRTYVIHGPRFHSMLKWAF